MSRIRGSSSNGILLEEEPRVEHGNKFGSAVTLGNDSSFAWPTDGERQIAAGCWTLIMNAINYYNLLYLSEKLRQCKPTLE